MEKSNPFTEVCVPFVVMFYVSFIYLFSKCLLHPTVGSTVQCAKNSQQKDKVAAQCWDTVFISNTVLINMSVSKSNLESFEGPHCLIYLCIIRARLGTK